MPRPIIVRGGDAPSDEEEAQAEEPWGIDASTIWKEHDDGDEDPKAPLELGPPPAQELGPPPALALEFGPPLVGRTLNTQDMAVMHAETRQELEGLRQLTTGMLQRLDEACAQQRAELLHLQDLQHQLLHNAHQQQQQQQLRHHGELMRALQLKGTQCEPLLVSRGEDVEGITAELPIQPLCNRKLLACPPEKPLACATAAAAAAAAAAAEAAPAQWPAACALKAAPPAAARRSPPPSAAAGANGGGAGGVGGGPGGTTSAVADAAAAAAAAAAGAKLALTGAAAAPPASSLVKRFVRSGFFEALCAAAILGYAAAATAELQLLGWDAGLALDAAPPSASRGSQPPSSGLFRALDAFFTCLFLLELALRLAAAGPRSFARCARNLLDMAVILVAAVVCVAPGARRPLDVAVLRLLRLPPLLARFLAADDDLSGGRGGSRGCCGRRRRGCAGGARGGGARGDGAARRRSLAGALRLLSQSASASAGVLFWSVLLLFGLQWVAGLLISARLSDYLLDEQQPREERRQVFLYFGTFTRSALSMFELTHQGSSGALRALVDYVGESYAWFFILYRGVVSFALLQVVRAVFVQQTMKAAEFDPEEVTFAELNRLRQTEEQLDILFSELAGGDDARELTLCAFRDALAEEPLRLRALSLLASTGAGGGESAANAASVAAAAAMARGTAAAAVEARADEASCALRCYADDFGPGPGPGPHGGGGDSLLHGLGLGAGGGGGGGGGCCSGASEEGEEVGLIFRALLDVEGRGVVGRQEFIRRALAGRGCVRRADLQLLEGRLLGL